MADSKTTTALVIDFAAAAREIKRRRNAAKRTAPRKSTAKARAIVARRDAVRAQAHAAL